MALAEEFVARTGITSFRMLWDPTFDSWAQIGVVSQPAWALYTPGGTYVEGAYGGIETDQVLSTAESL